MNELALMIAGAVKSKGFYTPGTISDDIPQGIDVSDGVLMLGKLMLVVTEVSEAAEAVRSGDMDGFTEELADTMIRLLDICGSCGIDIERAISDKMDVNKERPMRHGRKTAI
jgi:hypothetical protein